MKHLLDLFKLVELTRSQPQYGYSIHGIKQDELSNLAEHHYLVSFISWQLASNLIELGAKLDLRKVLEFALIHDLGELLGSDISMPYAKVNARAKKFAKLFEAENQRFLAKFFGGQSSYVKKLGKEILNSKSDEALLVKVADYLECTYYMAYVSELTKTDARLNSEKMLGYAKKIKDPVAKKELLKFINEWSKSLPGKSTLEILGHKK